MTITSAFGGRYLDPLFVIGDNTAFGQLLPDVVRGIIQLCPAFFRLVRPRRERTDVSPHRRALRPEGRHGKRFDPAFRRG